MWRKRTNTERLLVEFPWLWGIKRTWSRTSSVKVEPITSVELMQPIVEGEEWWLKLTYGSLHEVRIVHHTVGCDVTVAEAILGAMSSGYKIEYLATRVGDAVVVYRPIKGMNLHEACFDALPRRRAD